MASDGRSLKRRLRVALRTGVTRKGYAAAFWSLQIVWVLRAVYEFVDPHGYRLVHALGW